MNISEITQFMLAGKAIFTIQNEVTGNRFTYRVSKPKDFKESNPLWFVGVLSGSDNRSNYSYMGVISNSGFRRTAKSRVGTDALSYKAFNWLFDQVRRASILPGNIKFYHEGKCGKCGRKLTTPESLRRGLGPYCAENS